MKYSIKQKKIEAWYEKPISFSIRIKKSTIIIIILVGIILWPHVVHAQSLPNEAGIKPIPIAKLKAKEFKPYKPSKAIKKVQPKHIAVAPKKAVNVSSGCVTGYSTGNAALNQIIAHESGGRSCAENAGGCFGLLQACPGAPLKQACGGNPDCQISWFIANKTGGRSWEAIWALWQTQGWW